MAKIVYPLEQILDIKKRRVENAELVVKEKRLKVEQEEEKLKKCEAERDKVKQHHHDKLEQLRHELEHSTTSPKVQQMKVYLKVVQEKLKIEERKVKEQEVKVENANKELEAAKKELRQRQLEVDKMETHRTDWAKGVRKEQEIVEGRIQDELGDVIYTLNQRKEELMR